MLTDHDIQQIAKAVRDELAPLLEPESEDALIDKALRLVNAASGQSRILRLPADRLRALCARIVEVGVTVVDVRREMSSDLGDISPRTLYRFCRRFRAAYELAKAGEIGQAMASPRKALPNSR